MNGAGNRVGRPFVGANNYSPLPMRCHRRSIRLPGYDYASPGDYFVTICVKEHRPVFGTLVHGRVALNPVGLAARACWLDIPKHFPNAALDSFVIMPDHVHGIIRILREEPGSRVPRTDGTSRTVGSIVRGFKIGVVKAGPVQWQRNYYERILRDDEARTNVRRYIAENPRNAEVMAACGGLRVVAGDAAILRLPRVGFCASRDGVGGGALPIRKGEAVISGFLSPMERRVYRASLRNGVPMVWVRAWANDDSPVPERAVVVSPFDGFAGPSAQRAAWCNEFVIRHCGRLVVGSLRRGGMLDCLLADAPEGLRIVPLNGLRLSL